MRAGGKLAWVAAIAAMPAFTLGSIVAKGVNVPFADQWSMGRLFLAADDGTLGLAAFWAQHNEHRPLFPRAVDFGLAYVTGWDIRVELYVDFAVAAVTFVLLLVLLRRALDPIAFVIASIVASALFFSPVQWENWMWGWELEWFLCNLAALGCLWALTSLVDRSPRAGLLVAAALALVAALSLGQGLLLFPVGLVVLLVRGRPWRAWAVVTVAVPVVYFLGYTNPSYHPSKTLWLEHPVKYAEFVTLYLGRVFAFNNPTGGFAGAALIVAFVATCVYVVRQREDRDLLERSILWMGLGLYALGADVITGISRLGFGAAFATTSRYTTMAELFAIATLALLFVVGARLGRERIVAAAAAVILALALVNAKSGYDDMTGFGHRLEAYAGCIRGVQTLRDPCLRIPNPVHLPLRLNTVRLLRRKGWAGF